MNKIKVKNVYIYRDPREQAGNVMLAPSALDKCLDAIDQERHTFKNQSKLSYSLLVNRRKLNSVAMDIEKTRQGIVDKTWEDARKEKPDVKELTVEQRENIVKQFQECLDDTTEIEARQINWDDLNLDHNRIPAKYLDLLEETGFLVNVPKD